VLSDDRRRKRYDLTGSTVETLEDDEDFDWLSFYREQFNNVVTEESIKKISNEYKGSDAERRDLVNAYERQKGNLDRIYQMIMLSDILEDDDRFRKIFDEEIEKGTIESLPAYERQNTDEQREKVKAAERKRREQFDKQHGKHVADKAKAKQKSKGKKNEPEGMGDLAALIQQRQKARSGNFFDNLEAKYAPTSRGKKRAAPVDDEPPEEAFQAMRERPSRKAKTKAPVVDADDDDEDIEESVNDDEESEEERPQKKQRRGVARRGRARTAKAKA
jgi:DnaJ family protein C protein 9